MYNFREADVGVLTVWAGAGGLESGSTKVLCGGESDTPCAVGIYAVEDTGWVFDDYELISLEEGLEEEIQCVPV